MADLIYYKGHIYLVPGSQLWERILHAMHDSPLLRQQGFLKTYRRVRERFTWKVVGALVSPKGITKNSKWL